MSSPNGHGVGGVHTKRFKESAFRDGMGQMKSEKPRAWGLLKHNTEGASNEL